ncbi:MAG TPA: FAD-dependent oxidoreductase [Solibacterales bacterium]|nr:FAD-dependent oxidoreductase [Bryobacterales bacterium]
MNRRQFLYAAPSLLALPRTLAAARDLAFDVVVVGGGTGGCAAALAALRAGCRVALTEETDWIGGQLTSQSVPPDEHPWIEMFGRTASYADYRAAVRRYYADHFPLTAPARARAHLNPGDGSVSRITHEPRVSLAVLEQLLAPYVSGGSLTVLLRHKPTAALVSGDSVKAVTFRSRETGSARTLSAPFFIDATELGDLLPPTRTEYVTGFESRRQTGEPSAPEDAQPANMQAFTVCFALDYLPGEDHTIDKPDQYQRWVQYIPQLKPAWPGRLLSWQMSDPISLKPRSVAFDPTVQPTPPGILNLWLYRRIASRANFEPGAYASDITLVNWPQNDYWLGNLFDVPEAEAARHLESGRQLSLSLVYWMQTAAPRPDGGEGWKGLRLRPDVTGTEDGLAKYPYIRESRRIQAEFTVLEQHVSTEARMKVTGLKREDVRAEAYFDSVGVGSYRIDLHPSSGGDNYIDVSSLPFQIPLGALIPKRVRNLIAGAKNLGVTHITNGCYRLHPVEWNIGEAAGALAAECLRTKRLPTEIRNQKPLLEEFQRRLAAQGFELRWPALRPL